MFDKWIFWFRQDLRIDDNLWFINSLSNFRQVLPIFIFDEKILDSLSKNDNRINFIIAALKNLEKELKWRWAYLLIQFWDPRQIISNLQNWLDIDALFHNKSYWYFGKQRDYEIKKSLIEKNISYQNFNDYLLVEPEKIEKRKIFTPFYRQWVKHIYSEEESFNSKISTIQKTFVEKSIWNNIEKNNEIIFQKIVEKYWSNKSIENIRPIKKISLNNKSSDIFWQHLLKSYICTYPETRNNLEISWTTRLSPYIRFGILSIRKIYNYVNSLNCLEKEIFIKELAWREFWNHIAHNFPETTLLEFQEKRRSINWENNEKLFQAWCEGKTWFPIVDAAMRQLKEENWMHGRARMIVASFLTKNLCIDRRWGEKHFSKYLLDYDSNVNIGNWQWSAWVWADPKPLRIFNPILQTQKFDTNCTYIKKYIKQLEKFDSKDIIENPEKLWYFKPIVNLKESVSRFKELYYK